MLRGLYQVAGAMERASRFHEIAAENLIHATTPGYRRQGAVFATPDASSASEEALDTARAGRHSGPAISGFNYFDPGAFQQTNDPLDVALSGDAFFTIEGPNGPLYTRNGTFALGPSGVLQTRGGGYPVQGQNGPINIPEGSGPITIAGDGTVKTNGVEIGRLKLARFADPQTLRRVGPTLFEGDSPEAPRPETVRTEQGYREGSNVQPVQEMVTMMTGLRFYEAAQKAMQTLSDAVAQNTRSQ